MTNKSWAAVAGILLLTGIVASAIFFKQRNETRERLRESQDQIAVLERRNAELGESLQNQKSSLRAERDLGEQKQAALTAVEIQTTELNAQLAEKQAELETVGTRLQKVKNEAAELQAKLTSTESKLADLLNKHNELETERDTLAARLEAMESDAVKQGATFATLSQQVEEGDKRVAALEKEGQSLRDTVAVKEQQLAESQDTLKALRAAIEGLRKDLSAMKASASALDARLREVAAERDGLMAQTAALKVEGGGLRKRLAEMETRHGEVLADRNDKITELEAQLQDFVARVPALKNRLEQSLDSYQAVSEDLTEAKVRESKLQAQQKAMQETYEALLSGLKEQLDSKEASIEAYREKLKVTFVDRILFGFSQVRISGKGKAALDRLAQALSNVPEGRISIIGHADNVPVASKFKFRFPSNWELSSARAGAVARYLLNRAALDPTRIEVIGLSRYHPVADNDTQAGRAKNRRVEIIITPPQYQDGSAAYR
jgi:chemotaxis protein MotB